MTSIEERKEFEKDGYLIVENFLSDEEIKSLRERCRQLVDAMKPEEHHLTVFTTTACSKKPLRREYFMKSGHNISFFFEDGAFDDKGEMIVDRQLSINKIGHGLHVRDQTFKNISCAPKVQAIAKNFGYVDPKIVQSMYIFKQPRIGGLVVPHQDAAFIYNDPLKLFGYWFALEDCTKQNGCLEFVPGTHKTVPLSYRMERTEDGTGTQFTAAPNFSIPDDQYIPAEVKAGSLVLIDGKVVHRSAENKSDKSRHIYTFHVIDRHNTQWDKNCWLQPTEADPFLSLFTQET